MGRSLFVREILARSEPHGAHFVLLVEDAKKLEDAIVEIEDIEGGHVAFTGAELNWLADWWALIRTAPPPPPRCTCS